METTACDILKPVLFILSHIAVAVVFFIVGAMCCSGKPDPTILPTKKSLTVDALCWPDGDHTPPEYYKKDGS